MLALCRAGKTRKPPLLTKCSKAPGPARKYLVRIALVPHIPDKFILRGIKYPVQGHCQFYCSKVGRKMPAGAGNILDQKFAYLRT